MSEVEAITSPRLHELLVGTSRTFALSIPVLPEPLRREVTVAYLLFRVADTLEDATQWRTERQLRELARLADLLRSPAADQARRLARDWIEEPPLANPAYLELLRDLPLVLSESETLRAGARELVRQHTLRTVAEMARFVSRGRPLTLRDLADLQSYCHAVAGIVGEMLTELFVLDCPALQPVASTLRAAAAPFGEALQLVNILKDSASDAREGRGYLPPAVERARLFALARADLESAGEYVRCLQRAEAPRGLIAFAALPALLASRTLDRVERDGPGAKLTRSEVTELALRLESALDRGLPALSPAESEPA